MSIDLQQFHAVFLAEAEDHLAELERLLISFNTASFDAENINQIFRAAHSIKGSAGIFGFNKLSELTHILENIFDYVRRTQHLLKQDDIDICLDCVDALIGLLEGYKNGTPLNPTDAIHNALTALLHELKDTSTQTVTQADDFGFFEDLPPTETEQSFGFFDEIDNPEAESSTKPNTPNDSAKDQSSIRIDTAKIDQLINIIGELVIADSMLQQRFEHIVNDDPEGQAAFANINHNIRLMQDAVLSMRMLPLSYIFNRFNRVVREVAKQLDKKVELVILGGHTEIDKNMIEKLVDPITHLLRNALDHGIELPHERTQLNKPEQAQIIISAEQRGGFIFISVTDDGRGLNRDKVLSKATKQGLTFEPTIPDQDVWKMILAPGFSTANTVTDISGRGVGMDVVVQNIKQFNGSILIDSTEGKGASFTIRLPVTMAIVDGMKVMCHNQLYVLPMNMIIESFRPTSSQLKSITNNHIINIREAYYPLVSLHDVLHPTAQKPHPQDSIIVLIAAGNATFGLHVDSIEGQQQVVIKSLEKNYRPVSGIAGATVMGDGTVGYVLDAEQLALTAKEIAATYEGTVL